MTHPLYWTRMSFLYAIGNTTPVDLCQYLPPKLPSQILLLGCGDPRNILYTLSVSDPRSHDITCCDVEPAILARNVLIFSLIMDKRSSSVIWDIYFHMRLDKESSTALIDQCEKLIGYTEDIASWRSSPYGKVLRIGTAHTLAQLRRLWRSYADKDLYTGEGLQRLDSQLRAAAEDVVRKYSVKTTAARSAGPFSMIASLATIDHFRRYWKEGISPQSSEENGTPLPYINTTLAFSNGGLDSWPLHYGTDPFLAFHLASAFVPLKGNTKGPYGLKTDQRKLASTVRKEFATWCSRFSTFIRYNTVVIRFVVSEALAFTQALHYCSTTGSISSGQFASPLTAQDLLLDPVEYSQGAAPSSFNVIDTSNLLDHVGLINLLVCTTPLLQREPYSALLTEALLVSSEDPLTGLSTSTLTGLSVISLLFGLAPISYITNFTSHSDLHNVVSLHIINSSPQHHERLSWKFPSSGDPFAFKDTHSLDQKLTFDPTQLSDLLFRIYLKMFEAEGPSLLHNPSLQKIAKRPVAHYIRTSLAAFIKFIQTRITTDWGMVMERFLSLIMADRTLMLGANCYQELLCHLHLRGLYTPTALQPGFTAPGQDKARSRLSTWREIPPVVCVLFVVPRERLKILEDEDPLMVGTPQLHCEVYHPDSHNLYCSLQAVFGTVQVASAEKVTIIEDEKGWRSSSPFITMFWVPSWTLMQNPEELTVQLSLKSTPSAAKLAGLLGPALELFSTKMTDKEHVHILRDRPNAPGELTRLAMMTSAPTSSAAPDISLGSPAAEIVFDSAKKLHAVSTLTRRWSITQEKAKAALRGGKEVTLAQVSPCSIKVSFGSFSKDIPFPYPVDGTQSKLRIARKSFYLEVIAPVSGYQIPGGYSLNQTPVFSTPTGPLSWNIHYINLDELPIVDLSKSDSCDKALNTHITRTLSDREHANVNNSRGNDVIVDVKSTIGLIFDCIFKRKGFYVFGIGVDPHNIHTQIFIRNLRMDLSSHTFVMDAFAFILTENDMLFPPVNLPVMFVESSKEAISIWRRLLPALAERCRTWEHKYNCGYIKEGNIPLGIGIDRNPLCECGRGFGTEEFIKVKEWARLAPLVTRIALSPLFAVSYLEKSVTDNARNDQNPRTVDAAKDVCSGCGKTAAELSKAGKPKLMVCGRCKTVSYCSQECQRAAWKNHKQRCNAISQLRP
ncbi:hypothetical protein BDN72DRAFT_103975 [Pluteus cervinus]|uniref:Uncharacterized protein n=1 Tax=Pluteus cervinus TaxID=181527 RepID=A0ACD3B8L8_9AGAR|nr:hypothetical protein BDN72DRAFT_103975 [Pluteus cervinus]